MLRVSDNGRFLVRDDGAPFFFLGDTAWELFHRLTPAEAELYLRNRAAKGFSVIQAVALAEYDGLGEPNRQGDRPLVENDPARPNEAYFAHVDWVVDAAAALGLVVGLLPTWGDKVNKMWGIGPEVFTPANARSYGAFLGARYRDRPIIWVLGGDRPVESETHSAIWRELAAGIRAGGSAHPMTYHPSGGHSSTEYVADEAWVDFHMIQSGHDYNRPNYRMIAADYARTPAKPCMDGEPGYEDHPAGFKAENGFLSDDDVRKSLYWSLFAGAHGYTYGCHDIWQFFDPALHPPISFARTPWVEAIDLPGSFQLIHARRLVESRPFLGRIPDAALLVGEAGEGADHVEATRDEGGSYAFVYSASGQPFTVDLGRLSGERIAAHWYDPRTGAAEAMGDMAREGLYTFTPPSSGAGNDWVLVLDDMARGYGAPGAS